MKNKILLLLLVLSLSLPVFSQNYIPGPGGIVIFPSITTTGQLGNYISYNNSGVSPSNYTLDWSFAGTTPSACTFQAEGSSDSRHWYALTASTSCVTANMTHIAFKPVIYFRINILTYTQGDNTTIVTFNYTKGL